MQNEELIITATDLMNYTYCPTIIYYTHVLKRPQITTKKEYKGRGKWSESRLKFERSKVVKCLPKFPKIFNAMLYSKHLGAKTVVDSIIINKQKNEAYPLQVKYGYRPSMLYKTQRRQLEMEAMLVEDCLGYSAPFGFIKFLLSGDVVSVQLESRIEVFEAFKAIRQIITTENFPKATTSKKKMR